MQALTMHERAEALLSAFFLGLPGTVEAIHEALEDEAFSAYLRSDWPDLLVEIENIAALD
jgi:hypothetical protein